MNELQTGLYKTGVRIFEDLGFMLPSLAIENPADEELEAAVTVDFFGPVNGTMLLMLRGRVLSELTSNMLGEDGPPTLLQQQDALREVANVICGNFLPQIGGVDAVFDIGPPKILETRFFKPESFGNPIAVQTIELESGRADLHLFDAGSN
jgi:CheY-specific phosphatase CheX